METIERAEDLGSSFTPEQRAVIEACRVGLPLQTRAKALQEAELIYQTVRWGTARRRIARTLPRRPFKLRRVRVWEVADYPHFIPDAALLKLAEARGSGLFAAFWVVEPTYERVHTIRSSDPWLIGLLERDSPPFYLRTRVSMIAYWE